MSLTEEEIIQRNSEIADIFVQEFDAPVQILTATEDETGVISGNLLSAGEFYTYAFDDESLGIVHHEDITNELNEYAQGLLNGYGIKTDSFSPYEYALGMLRVDAQVRCSKGGTPCGKICLPKGAVCRKYGSGGGNLKTGGGAALTGGIVTGVAGVGTAAAVGGLAYINRENLASGGKAVSERLKRAGTEGYSELKTGLSAAKTSLQTGFKTAQELNRNLESGEKNLLKSENSQARLVRRGTTASTVGGGIGGAAGTTVAGVENSARAVGRNLKAAGKDVKTTAKNSVNTTKKVVASVKERFFNNSKSQSTTSSAIVPTTSSAIVPTTSSAIVSTEETTKKKRGRPPKK